MHSMTSCAVAIKVLSITRQTSHPRSPVFALVSSVPLGTMDLSSKPVDRFRGKGYSPAVFDYVCRPVKDGIEILINARGEVPPRFWLGNDEIRLFDLNSELEQNLELKDHLFSHHHSLLGRVLHAFGVRQAHADDFLNQAGGEVDQCQQLFYIWR